jgi:hypothetical protein
MKKTILVSILFSLFFITEIQAGDGNPCPSCIFDQKIIEGKIISDGEVFTITDDSGALKKRMFCLEICEDIYQCIVFNFKKPELESGISERKLAKNP